MLQKNIQVQTLTLLFLHVAMEKENHTKDSNGDIKSERTAYGTLMDSMLPVTDPLKAKSYDHLTVYFDTVENSWRSFLNANLISVFV